MILLFLLSNGCVDKEKNTELFHYEIEVKTLSSDNFIIFYPIPLISRDIHPDEGKPSKLMDEILVEYGTVQYSINKTEYGYALVLTSNESFKVIAHREIIDNEINENDYIFGNLSMQSGEKSYSPYWIYFNSTSSHSITINSNSYWRTDPEDCEIFKWKLEEFQPRCGWQTIEFERK